MENALARLFGAAKVKMQLARPFWVTLYAPILDQMARIYEAPFC
jgi:hypothetical protein